MHQQVHLQWWRESVSKNDSLGRRPGKGGGGNGGPAEEPLAELAMAAELVPYIDEKETLSKATCRFMAKRLLQVFTALSLCFHCPFSVLSPHFTVCFTEFPLSFHRSSTVFHSGPAAAGLVDLDGARAGDALE